MSLLDRWEGEPVDSWRRTWRAPALEAHDVIDSTNDRARELADAGAAPFTVVIADEQTAGRGRSGRRWHSAPRSGLWISTLLPATWGAPAHLPLLVGLAAARAAETAAPPIGVIGLKWPNDLMLRGRKVGGILCERHASGVVAGVGLNVRRLPDDFPPELRDIATSLEDSGGAGVSMAKLVTILLEELHALCERPPKLLGGEVRDELTARDVLVARVIDTEEHGAGTARGIDVDGALILERADGTRVRVLSGSVRPVQR